jgi:hypothetical protein
MQVNLKEEMTYLSLGDKRRDKRFIKIVEQKISHPCNSIPETGKTWSDIKMTYEFYDNDKVSETQIASCIQKATVDRCLKKAVLNILDTTNISFSSSAEGLGYIDGAVGEGLMVHNSLAVDEQGCPLGLLSQKIWARDKSQMGKRKFRNSKDISEKESYRWIESIKHAENLLKDVPLVIHIADRESDIYELFAIPRATNSELLIRATHDRKTLLGNNMWEEIERGNVLTIFELDIPKVASEGGQKLKMEVRADMVMLSPPVGKTHLPSLIVYGIVVRQADKKENGLEWRLISTMPVKTAAEAMQCVQRYSYRWRIERFHYILKSGCRLEDLQLRNVNALRKAIIIYSLCAFKIMEMLHLSRTQPNQPCTNYFSEKEWRILSSLSNKYPVIKNHAPTLQECVKMIAKLGGYLARNSDGPPGIKNLWRGLQKFNTILQAINYKQEWLSTF